MSYVQLVRPVLKNRWQLFVVCCLGENRSRRRERDVKEGVREGRVEVNAQRKGEKRKEIL